MIKLIRGGWFHCPVCDKKMFRLDKETEVKDFPAWCRRCKKEYLISVKGTRVDINSRRA